MTSTPTLERILWTQVVRVLDVDHGPWQPEHSGARAIHAGLWAPELAAEETGALDRWVEEDAPASVLLDRLLQARVDRAVREGLRAEAQAFGLTEVPPPPPVLVVRQGSAAAARPQTIIQSMSALSVDVAELAPGAKLDDLVDMLVLANPATAASLQETLGDTVSVVTAEEAHGIDLLLPSATSIQVRDVEAELEKLEQHVRGLLPGELRPAPAARDLTGEILGGKYRIKGLKGKGAFKTVYEGEDEMLGARVAVAVLNPKGARSPRALRAFQDEARLLTTLDHPNIVRWVTFDRTDDGLHYFVMEYLDGEELETTLRREGRLEPKRAAEVLLQVVGALRRAHAPGEQGALLHLDLKPENVFVRPSLVPGEPERVKVIDFGISQHVGAEVWASERPELRTVFDLSPEDLHKSIGSVGVMPEDVADIGDASAVEDAEDADPDRPLQHRVQRARGGTLLYASPEQCKHLAGHRDIEELDGRSDLYSLGVLAFRLLTGQYPFARNATAYEAIQNHLEAPPRRVGSLGVRIPRKLAAFVDRCLEKDRSKRWKDAGEAHEALQKIVHPGLSPLRVGAALGGVAAVVAGLLWFNRAPHESSVRLVDPGVTSVSERVVDELYLGQGPESSRRTLQLESDEPWEAEALPAPRLFDADGGDELAGWRAGWSAAQPGHLVITLDPDGASTGAVLELVSGRWRRWRSGRLALNALGRWSLGAVAVQGRADDTGRLLDPRGRRLAVEVLGDPAGREAIESLRLFDGDALLDEVTTVSASDGGELARYAGPALDALFPPPADEVQLRLVARDRAGQEEEFLLRLWLAGEPPDFTAATGFVGAAESDAALLPFPGQEQVLLSGNALRVASSAAGRLRVVLEAEAGAEEPLERNLTAGRPELFNLEELGIAGPEQLRATLRLELDDAPLVDRAAPLPVTRRLAFHYVPAPPALDVQLVDAEGNRPLVESGEEGRPTHVRLDRPTRLRARSAPGPDFWIEAVWLADGGEAAPAQPLIRAGGAYELALEPRPAGAHRLVLRRHVLEIGDQRGALVPPELVYDLVADHAAPEASVTLDGAVDHEGAKLFRGDARVVAHVSENTVLSGLHWTLQRPDGTRISGDAEPTSEFPLPMADETQDGLYSLEVRAVDRAGNVGLAEASWQLAREGPELDLLAPAAPRGQWVLGSGRDWNLQVRASDPNGVAGVAARVLREGELVAQVGLERSGEEIWELPAGERLSAMPWWTGDELAIELLATDAAGRETQRSLVASVPRLQRAARLVVAPGERLAEAMIEVRVEGDYVFGGRAGEGRRAWKVPIARGLLRDFYLDACEVTCGEYLTFLDDERGWPDAGWWPSGSAPDAARRDALRSAFTAVAANSPATGVRWSEAAAYAAWRGKRLPTLVEWEYAVRGRDYRVRPEGEELPGVPESWPANLCGDALEWTATPERLVDEDLDPVSQYRARTDLLVDTDPSALRTEGSYWVVGGAAGQEADWTARTLRHAGAASGGSGIGFRCALGAKDAQALLDRGAWEILD